jgi:hypothetical protein
MDKQSDSSRFGAKLLVLLSLIAVALASIPAKCATLPADNLGIRCESLSRVDFSRILDAPTQLIETKFVRSDENARGYCQVTGYVSPNIGFALRLPIANWNGRLIELGCSGKCGTLEHLSDCQDPVRRGYACVVSDGGHKSTPSDAKWAYNNFQAQVDYLVRASHVTALAGKSVAQRYYAYAPKKSYFVGCSAGGTQAMQEAQKFPWDFDGIIAGAPSLSWTASHMNKLWANRALTGEHGKPLLQQHDLDILHRAVVRKCDRNDGVKDGLIGDPRACDFDPGELVCTRNGTDCLTEVQIQAVRKIYGGAVTEKGEQVVRPAALRGSEQTWRELFWGPDTDTRATYNLVSEGFRYQDFQPNPGPMWRPEDFDFDRDYKRLGIAGSLEPVNPDLRAFRSTGGKLLIFTGWADAIEGVLDTVDYYQTTERVIGSRSVTQEFFRLFVIPGMYHCGGGEGASTVDYLSYMEAWVEKGQPPERLIASHVTLADPLERVPDTVASMTREVRRRHKKLAAEDAKSEFSRPVYPYPVNIYYLGSGNQNDAANFGPKNP